ncbi:Sodium/calcium exchanger protein-domain-containing protein [Aspergillus insuetus]
MDWNGLCFNTATLIAGVFVLDHGADKFIDHTVIVGRRLGISPTLIALLTAGAEYEELAVVVAALVQHRSPLALGNVIGSTISNILGAFSLGLLCQPGGMEFDRGAKMYSALMLFVTTLFVALAYFHQLNRVSGGILIAVFVLYLASIGYAIYRGIAEAPPLSDSDSDSDSDREVAASSSLGPSDRAQAPASEHSPLLHNPNNAPQLEEQPQTPESNNAGGTMRRARAPRPRPLYYHIIQLIYGLLALSLSGYILATSAGAIADTLQLSGTVFGLTIVAFATTLPEKFIAILSGARGHGGIVVAATAGSNIFLLTLCVGIVAVAGIGGGGGGGGGKQEDGIVLFDLAAVWVAAVSFTAVVFWGLGRWAGGVLLVAYVVFLVLEFTVFRR